MKLRKLLPIVFLAVTGLTGCGDKNVYTVEVTNADAIKEEWHVGDAARTLTVAATLNGEDVNATQLLNSEVFVTSSNEEVLTALGFVLTPVAAGEVTVKVEYHSALVELDLTIRPLRTCADKYGTVHAGTEEDPLDYADALNIGGQMKAAAKSTDEEDIYIKGVVKSWYHFPGERAGNDEATSWFLQGAEGDKSFFEVYKCVKSNGKSLSDEDVWVGAEVLVYGQIGYYGTQLETTKATFVRVTGGAERPEVQTKQTGVNTKNTGALAVGKALEDGDTTWDKYEITGYTVNILGTNKDGSTNYMIADSKDETASNKMFEIYGCKETLKYQEKVKVSCRIKNYHGTIETNLLTAVEVLEAGKDWPNYPQPEVNKTGGLAGLFADTAGNYKQLYEVTGTISKWVGENKDATKYGNFYLVEEGSETEYYIYGATATASALTWNKYANKFAFVNPQDFLENAVTKEAAIGAKVTMQLTRCDYTKDDVTTLEATGVVLSLGIPADVTLTPNKLTAADNTENISQTVEGITVALSKGTITADQIRCFKNQTLTISVASGKIAKIQFTCTASGDAQYGPGCFTVESGYTVSEKLGVWKGSASSVVFTASTNQVRITEILIWLAA